MSLIIEGMDMPEYVDVYGDGQNKCVYLLMLNVRKDGTASVQFTDIDGGFYRVKEIPTPHGRLIDADAFEKKLQHLVMSKEPYQRGMAKAFLAIISCEPTIIEAEVSE